MMICNSCTYQCARSSGVMVNFISFTEQEIRPFSIKKYVKGSNFTSFIDSLLVTDTVTRYGRSNDSLIWQSSIGSARMPSDYDYIVYIPAVNSTYRITELYEPQREGKKSTKKIMCVNAVVSCRINGVLTQILYDRLFLKK